MARLEVTGDTVLVDDADLPLVEQFKWHTSAARTAKTRYAYTTTGVQMANVILPPVPGFTADHINGNGLDNRRDNLRYATRAEQQHNQGPREGTSAFKGVSLCKSTRRWRADITIDWGTRNIGRYLTERDAASAYDAAATILHGEFARLNFDAPSADILEQMRRRLSTRRPARKLSADDVTRIRQDNRSSYAVAADYGVSSSRVRAIRR